MLNRYGIIVLTIVPVVTVSAITTCLSSDNQRVEVVDANRQLCCNGVHAKVLKNGDEQKCCEVIHHDSGTVKRQVYNSRTSFCCGGVLYHLQPSKNYAKPKCCGDMVLLNQTTEFCCGNKTYKRSPQHHQCFETDTKSFTIRSDEKVCSIYSKNRTEVKVYTRAQVKRNGSDCCGLTLYDQNDLFCFKEELWPYGSLPAECGPAHTVHDQTKTVCCQDTGKLIPIPESHAKYHNINPNYRCFKGRLFDGDIKDIFQYEGVVVPKHFKPCGSEYYDPSFSRGKVFCCNGTVNYARSDMDVRCCGNELIDNTEHNCCNDRKLPKSQGCCGNSIYDKYKSDLQCCGMQLYNNSYLCCRPYSGLEIPTLKRKRNDNTCCGKTTFHPLEGDCCGGKVYEKLAQKNQKCNGNGEVVNVTMLQPKLKDIRHQLNNSRDIGSEKPKRQRRINDCPACLPYEQPFQECTKRFRYQIYVRKIEAKPLITKVHVLLLEPSFMRKTKMVLKTSGKCKCFKPDTVYNLYSNRNLKEKIKVSKIFQSKFTERDMLFEVKGNFGDFRREHICKVERFYKPFVP
ncbi:uncharacterized protein LOC123545301 [Mercenaria mercenaria]|uniref:uncharacterized protein LOC123545301 n=1 Tax=Mercenaria mercenaria TaxID=6596 RepID=UPI00234F6E14|nr:uncharacterized protein LOC123545301 [Mercenaria mercenaria]